MKAGFYLNFPQDIIRGSTCSILTMLSQCPVILYLIIRLLCDNTRAFEINCRSVIATLTSGNGLESLKQFCADMNMPRPMKKSTVNYHACVVKETTEKAVVDSMETEKSQEHT